jgi:hypothetical protein
LARVTRKSVSPATISLLQSGRIKFDGGVEDMKMTEKKDEAARTLKPRALIPVAEQAGMKVEELAQAILDRRLRPGAAQLRLLAEAVLAMDRTSGSAPKKASKKPANKGDKKSKKVKKGGKKKGRRSEGRKLPKIPKGQG